MARRQQHTPQRHQGAKVAKGAQVRRTGGAILGAAAAAGVIGGLTGFTPPPVVSAGVSRIAEVGARVPFAVSDWDAAGTGAALAALVAGVGSVVVIRRSRTARPGLAPQTA